MPVVLITGGAGNLGKTVVDTLYDANHSLYLTVMSESDIDHNKGSKYPVDLTSSTGVENVMQSIVQATGKIDAGVFLAGGYMPGGLDKISVEDVRKMVTLNFETAFNAALLLITHFRTTGGGKLIFTGAKAAMDNTSAMGNVAYALSKQMLFNFCGLINESEKGNHITAHILLPNTLDTALNRSLMPDADFSKWTKPSEVAAAIKNIIEGNETDAIIRF